MIVLLSFQVYGLMLSSDRMVLHTRWSFGHIFYLAHDIDNRFGIDLHYGWVRGLRYHS